MELPLNTSNFFSSIQEGTVVSQVVIADLQMRFVDFGFFWGTSSGTTPMDQFGAVHLCFHKWYLSILQM
jgi:hypothetical protein